MEPFKNVPLFRTTALDCIITPIAVFTPATFPFSTITSFTTSCQKSKFSIFSSFFLQVELNNALSHCARGLHIAGPLDLFKSLYCMALISVTSPVSPPRASISLTICPLAIPPIAGLQLI